MKKTILLFFSLVAFCLNAQTESGDALWDYPVKQGMPEWASFTTGAQMWDACQIPDKIMEALNTKDLVKICLDFPIFFDFALVDDERYGADFAIKRFNGLSENYMYADETLLTEMSKIISGL